jgi:hypothetical protein
MRTRLAAVPAFALLLLLLLLLLGALAPAPALAGGTPARVVSASRDRLVLRFEADGGKAFPNGMRDIEVRAGGRTVVVLRAMSRIANEVTFAVVKGKAAALAAGSPVEVEHSAESEGVDGC